MNVYPDFSQIVLDIMPLLKNGKPQRNKVSKYQEYFGSYNGIQNLKPKMAVNRK